MAVRPDMHSLPTVPNSLRQGSFEAFITHRALSNNATAVRADEAGAHQAAMRAMVLGAKALQGSLSISPSGPVPDDQVGLSLAPVGLHVEVPSGAGCQLAYSGQGIQPFGDTHPAVTRTTLDLSPLSRCSPSSPVEWPQEEPLDITECGHDFCDLISPAIICSRTFLNTRPGAR